jgi:polyvinyl alcohol dehydrogenase (cytochrome)
MTITRGNPHRLLGSLLAALLAGAACETAPQVSTDAGSTTADASAARQPDAPASLEAGSAARDAVGEEPQAAADAQIPDGGAVRDAAASDAGSAAHTLGGDPADWPMALYDPLASGHNPHERLLGRENVAQLEVKWRFDARSAGHDVAPIHATPVVAADTVYVGSLSGVFYAVDREGRLLWQYHTRPPNPVLATLKATPVGAVLGTGTAPIVGAAVLPAGRPHVIFGDLDGNVYALDRRTGAELWVKSDVDAHPLSGVFGNSLVLAGDSVVVGFASVESMALNLLAETGYECCSFRGVVSALDVESGAEKWRFHTAPPAAPLPSERAPYLRGPSGASVWGQPSYDADTRTIYVGTGANYSPTASGDSTELTDAIVALDADTGTLKWSYQATKNDIWSEGEFNPKSGDTYLDADFGDSPKIYDLPGVGKVVGAGQKTGAYHVLDARSGALVKRTEHLKMFNTLGGFQNLGGYANGIVYEHGTDRLTEPSPLWEDFNGSVLALSPDGERMLWRFDVPLSPLIGGLAIANDVLYVVSPFEEPLLFLSEPEWAFYAVDATSGRVLKRMAFPERAIASPVVSRGRVYVTEGNAAFTVLDLALDTTGGVLCLGLPGSN